MHETELRIDEIEVVVETLAAGAANFVALILLVVMKAKAVAGLHRGKHTDQPFSNLILSSEFFGIGLFTFTGLPSLGVTKVFNLKTSFCGNCLRMRLIFSVWDLTNL